jgi:hypothetical protein
VLPGILNPEESDVKKLLTGIVAFAVAVGCTVAQAMDAYDSNGRLIHRSVQNGNITRSYTSDGRLLPYYTVRNGNSVRTYDINGHLQRTGFRRGNTSYIYDRNGRLLARGYFNSDGSSRMYDGHGHYIGSTSR